MTDLNCGSFELALESVSGALDMTAAEIIEQLRVFDIEAPFEPRPGWSGYRGGLVLQRLVSGNRTPRPFEQTHWFHLTRIRDPEVLRGGILPLGECIDRIWDYLYSLVEREVTRSDWVGVRRAMECGSMGRSVDPYRLKTSERVHWGPFGLLVREAAFVPGVIGNHDYLELPEIIEDICSSASLPKGVSLRRRFLDSTTPCIVQFRTPGATHGSFESALYYVYSKIHQLPLCLQANSCWDGECRAVQPSQIVSVECVQAGAG